MQWYQLNDFITHKKYVNLYKHLGAVMEPAQQAGTTSTIVSYLYARLKRLDSNAQKTKMHNSSSTSKQALTKQKVW